MNEDPEHDGADEDEQMDDYDEYDDYDDYDDRDDRDESDLDPDERYITVRARRRLASIWASPDRVRSSRFTLTSVVQTKRLSVPCVST